MTVKSLNTPDVRLEAAKTTVESIAADDMVVDGRYQRNLRAARIEALKGKFNWDALGVPCVNRRADDTIAVVDGQHRRELLRQMGYGAVPVECEVFHGLTVEEEAALFRLRNHSEKVPLIDLFRARLIAGEPKAQEIGKILHRHGWKLQTSGRGEGVFNAIGKLEKVYDWSPAAADRTVRVLTGAWGYGPIAGDGRLVAGLGRVFKRYSEQIDVENLIDRLAKFPGGAKTFLGLSRGLQSVIGGTVEGAAAEKFLEVYNVRRSKTALPSLRAAGYPKMNVDEPEVDDNEDEQIRESLKTLGLSKSA